MRRSDREVTDFDEIADIIAKCDVCRLALNDEEYPYILPLNFGHKIDNGEIILYFHGATEGRKYELIEKNNKAGFEMDCSHRLVLSEAADECTMEYESVIGSGTIEYVSEAEKYDALCVLMEHYYKGNFTINKDIIPATKIFKLTVEKITAKRRMKK